MKMYKLTKSFFNTNTKVALLLLILGILFLIFFEKFSPSSYGRLTIVILSTPVILIYYVYKYKTFLTLPENIVINFNTETILVEQTNYSFSAIKKLAIVEKKGTMRIRLSIIDGLHIDTENYEKDFNLEHFNIDSKSYDNISAFQFKNIM